MSRRTISVSVVQGTAVKNPDGEHLGKIEDLVVDKHEGVIAYAVLSFGGMLGIGAKLFAVPWSALRYSTEDDSYLLDVDRDRLEAAPGFSMDDWPDMTDESWGAEVSDFYAGPRRR